MALLFSCKDITELASQRLDRRLPLHRLFIYRFHLLMCRLCTRYHRHMRFMHKMMHIYAEQNFGGNGVGPKLSEEAKERMKARMANGE